LNTAVKYIVGNTWQPLLRKYLSKARVYRYKNIRLQIPSSVFHPGFFFSTHLLLDQIKKISLSNKKLLEPGAGSGLISIYAAQNGAIVTATDINPVAIECLKENSRKNNVQINIIESDLFDGLQVEAFDLIVINPPYYTKDPTSYADYAWNCGSNGEYFTKLFSQLKNYMHSQTKIWMVLCDGCDINMVRSIAGENGFTLDTVLIKRNMIETNFIYNIEVKQ
jgi:release factor glutamine methyltransferase